MKPQDFVNLYRTVRDNPEWNSLSFEEQQQIEGLAKGHLQKEQARRSGPEFRDVQAIADTEKQFEGIDRNLNADRNIGEAGLGALRRGISTTMLIPQQLAAFGADVIGADKTAEAISENVAGQQQAIQARDPSMGKTLGLFGGEGKNRLGWSDIPRFAVETLGENIPLMGATAGLGTAIKASKFAAMLPKVGWASKAINPYTIATYGAMSLPEMYKEVKANGGGPLAAAFFAIPHAGIENISGITPARVASWFSKDAVEKVIKAGGKAALKDGGSAGFKSALKEIFLKGFKDGLGEGSEELLQGLTTRFAKHFSDGRKSYAQAVKDFSAEMSKEETWNEMATEFAGGAIFGLAGGAFEAAQKAGQNPDDASNILANEINKSSTTPEQAQKLAKAKNVLGQVLQIEYQPAPITDATADAFQVAEPKVITPQEVGVSTDELRATKGTIEDYKAYQDEKQLKDDKQPTTGIGLANKFLRVRNLPDDNPVKVAFMQHLEDRGLAPIVQEAYDETEMSDELRALDEAEIADVMTDMQEGVADYEQKLLPFTGELLPGGEVTRASDEADFINLKSGKPFKSKSSAKGYQKKNNLQDTHDIVAVRGGYSLMRKATGRQAERQPTVETPTAEQAPVVRKITRPLLGKRGGIISPSAATKELKARAKEIFSSVKKAFGITDNLSEAGYVLPDGTLLDFSGRGEMESEYRKVNGRFVKKSGRDYMAGQRSMDHREIGWDGSPDDRNEAMTDFLRMGAIRIDANSGMISIHGRPQITTAQKAKLRELVEQSGGAYIDLEDDAKQRAGIEVEGPVWKKVLGVLNKWTKGETPSGGKLFSIEQLVLEAPYQAYKKAKPALKYGAELIIKGITTFSKWASAMVKQFGNSVRKHLKSMFDDAKKVLHSRRGMIRTGGFKDVVYSANELEARMAELDKLRENRDLTDGEEAEYDDLYQAQMSRMEIYGDDITQDGKGIEFIQPTMRSLIQSDIDFRDRGGYLSEGLERGISDMEDGMLGERYDNAIFKRDQIVNKLLQKSSIRRDSLSHARLTSVVGELISRTATPETIQNEIDRYDEIRERHFNKPPKIKNEQHARQITGLYSIEYLAAKTIYKGFKLAKRAISYGVDLLSQGVNNFAKWSKSMIDKHGPTVRKYLSNLFKDASRVLKSRRGMIDLTPTTDTATAKQIAEMNEKLVKSSDFTWKKESKTRLVLEFYHKQRQKYYPIATITKDARGRWNLSDSDKSFLTLDRAKREVKDLVYNKVRDTAIKGDRFKAEEMKRQRAINTQKRAEIVKAKAKKAKANAYFATPTATEKAEKRKAKEPVTIGEKVERLADRTERYFADRRLKLRRLQEQIEQNNGEPLPDDENAYQRYEIIDGRIETGTKDFKADTIDNVKADLVKLKMPAGDWNKFVTAMHANERNDQINKINPEFKERGIDGSGMSFDEAKAIKKEMFAKYGEDNLMAIGKKYWSMFSKLLKVRARYGLLSDEEAKAIDDTYEFYSPMKHISDDDSIVLDKRATGRRSPSEHALMFAEADIDATFRYGEHNRARQAFASMAMSNPSDAYSTELGEVKPAINKTTGEVEYKLDTFSDNEKKIHAKFGGKSVITKVNDADVLDALKTNPNELKTIQPILNITRMANNLVAATSVAYNIGFTIPNLIRDTSLAAIKSTFDKSGTFAVDMLKEIPQSYRDLTDAIRGKDTQGAREAKEWKAEGGSTGFTDMYSLEKKAKNIEKDINDQIANGKWYRLKSGVKAMADMVMTMNEISEGLTRFSAYKVARRSGMSKQQSAALAKNLTVNFNKKGKIGSLLNSLYVFANAGLQGTNTVVKLLNKMSKSKRGIATISAMISLGVAQEVFNTLVGGIDPEEDKPYWQKVADHIKDTNFVIMFPGGKHVKIPLPYGLNVLPALGRNAVASMMGNQTVVKSGSNMIAAIAGAFNPLGSDERVGASFIPTIGKLPLDVITNTKWTGKSIEKGKPPFGAEMPRHQRGFTQTSKQLTAFTKALSDATGGNEIEGGSIDISPAMLQHIIETLTGGIGKTATRGIDTISRIASGEAIEPENIPIIRRFYGTPTDYNVYEDYRKYADVASKFSTAKSTKNYKWMKENRYAYRISEMLKRTKKRINAVDGYKNISDKERKERVIAIQKEFNKKSKQIIEKNLSK